MPRIEVTVVATSKPAPLVADPKFKPTVPIALPLRSASSSSHGTTRGGDSVRAPTETDRRARSNVDLPAVECGLLQQLEDLLLDAVGLRERRDTGLGEHLILG